MNDYIKKLLFQFSIICQNLCIDEHIALENKNVRNQLAIKEPLENKIKSLTKILKEEF
tara:strand:+ start:111 stop:284 length:174 start_codon:yes stop_codon:yes gene_type:complete